MSVPGIFKIGIGPPSSHTVEPMKAAVKFAKGLRDAGSLERVDHVKAELYGSLGATGKGHGSDVAVALGLEGDEPDKVATDSVGDRRATIRQLKSLWLLGERHIAFDEKIDVIMSRRETLPFHPNGMRFTAYDSAGQQLDARVYNSVGGGSVRDESATTADGVPNTRPTA